MSNISPSDIEKYFKQEQSKLFSIYQMYGQGAARDASGKLYEGLIDECIRQIGNGIVSKVGTTDYLSVKYEHPGGELFQAEVNNIQVDRHIWKNGKRLGFIEAKTYLDAPYLKRAVSDLLEIKHALELIGEPTKTLKYIVFAGQNAIADNTRRVQEARFWTESALRKEDRVKLEIVFVHASKRSSSNPIYANCFPIDYVSLLDFEAKLLD